MFLKMRLNLILSLLLWTVLAVACAEQKHHFPTSSGGGKGRGGSGSNSSPEQIEKATSAETLKAFALKLQQTDSLDFKTAVSSAQRYLGYSPVSQEMDTNAPVTPQISEFVDKNHKVYSRQARSNPNLPPSPRQQKNGDLAKTEKNKDQTKAPKASGAINHLDIQLDEKAPKVAIDVVYSNKTVSKFTGTVEQGVSEMDSQDGLQKLSFACLNTDCGLQLVAIKSYGQDKGAKKLSNLQAFVLAKITSSVAKTTLTGYYDLNLQASRLKMEITDSKNNSVALYSKKFNRENPTKIQLGSDAGDLAELELNALGSKKSLTGQITFDGEKAVDLAFKNLKDYDFFIVPEDRLN